MNSKPQLSQELARIPTVAKVLAALAPVCVLAVVFIFAMARATQGPAPVGPGRGPGIAAFVMLIVPALVSVVFAIWILLVGYVYQDAGRRGMSRLLWMLVVIFVPNALGFILYFILRHPVLAQCPGCGQALNEEVAYCPHCGVQVAHSCSKCGRMVGLSDRFCSACGNDLKSVTEQPG